MADVELLPLPEREQLANPYAHVFGSVTAYGHTDETLTTYARACVEANLSPLQAENERLRAERLAEALRDAAAALDVAGLSGNAKRFHAALEQENDDA